MEEEFELIIRGGRIFSGKSESIQVENLVADIGIVGDRIVKIGNLEKKKAKHEIDATNLIVCPGNFYFISKSSQFFFFSKK